MTVCCSQGCLPASWTLKGLQGVVRTIPAGTARWWTGRGGTSLGRMPTCPTVTSRPRTASGFHCFCNTTDTLGFSWVTYTTLPVV